MQLLVLDCPQQLGLELDLQITYFVEQERAAIRHRQEPFAPPIGARKSAALMAPQLAFHQVVGQSTAGDCDVRTVAARRQFVNRARHHFLAGSAFPDDRNWGGIRRRRFFDQPHDATHRG